MRISRFERQTVESDKPSNAKPPTRVDDQRLCFDTQRTRLVGVKVTCTRLDAGKQRLNYYSPMTHVPRYVPAKTNQGWPVVGLIALLTISLIAAVTVIHQRTYKHPGDPTWHAVGGAGATEPTPAH